MARVRRWGGGQKRGGTTSEDTSFEKVKNCAAAKVGEEKTKNAVV